MRRKAIDLDEALSVWAAQYRLEPEQTAAVHDAVLDQEVVFDVTSHHWWADFIETVMRNALRPVRLGLGFSLQPGVK